MSSHCQGSSIYVCMLLALEACMHINENTARPKTWNTFSYLSCISIARKVEIVRQKSGHAVTRIRTWVVTATTWSTNHYTITARNPAALPAICKMHIQAASFLMKLTVINRQTPLLLLAYYIFFSYLFNTCLSSVFVLCFVLLLLILLFLFFPVLFYSFNDSLQKVQM